MTNDWLGSAASSTLLLGTSGLVADSVCRLCVGKSVFSSCDVRSDVVDVQGEGATDTDQPPLTGHLGVLVGLTLGPWVDRSPGT